MDIRYSKQAIKFLKKQNQAAAQRITSAISLIPYGDIKKLKGASYYRLRVGDFRIIFDKDGIVLHIIKIGNRGDVY